MSECDSSNHPAFFVVIVVVIVVVVVNFLLFQLLPLNRCTDLHQIMCECSFSTPTKIGKISVLVLPLFFMKYWIILYYFCPILKKIFL